MRKIEPPNPTLRYIAERDARLWLKAKASDLAVKEVKGPVARWTLRDAPPKLDPKLLTPRLIDAVAARTDALNATIARWNGTPPPDPREDAVAFWIKKHGTLAQRRADVHSLPWGPIVEAIEAHLFAPLDHLPQFAPITEAEMYALCDAEFPTISTRSAPASPTLRGLASTIASLAPGMATWAVRQTGRDDLDAVVVSRDYVKASITWYGLKLARNYAAPAQPAQPAQPAPPPTLTPSEIKDLLGDFAP